MRTAAREHGGLHVLGEVEEWHAAHAAAVLERLVAARRRLPVQRQPAALEVDVHAPAVEQLGRPVVQRDAAAVPPQRVVDRLELGRLGVGHACAAPPSAPTATRCGSGAASSGSSRT